MIQIETAPDQDTLAQRVAEAAIAVLREVQISGREPVFALTGGGMGIATLTALDAHPSRDDIDWSRVTLIWGDERWLPAGDAERNDFQADGAALNSLRLDPVRVHRVAASDSGSTLDEAAERYAAVVDSLPKIDLALFGLGPDGHVASLFPGREDLLREGPRVPSALAVRDSPKPPPERVSLSLGAICRADRVWLLAAGSGKALAVENLRSPGANPIPAARITGSKATILWADFAALGESLPA